MIKRIDWNKLKANVYDYYTTFVNDTVSGIRRGELNEGNRLNIIIVTRYMKTLDLMNVKEDDIQLSDGYKDYDEVIIDHCLKRINMILNTSFNVPIVYNEVLDKVTPN